MDREKGSNKHNTTTSIKIIQTGPMTRSNNTKSSTIQTASISIPTKEPAVWTQWLAGRSKLITEDIIALPTQQTEDTRGGADNIQTKK